MKGLLLTVFLCVMGFYSIAQQPDTSIFSLPVQMDEVTVKAARGGWDVAGFIRRVQQDTTFYKAFRTLHLFPYTAVSNVEILDKKGRVKAASFRRTRQEIRGRCRTMQTLEERHSGDYYKKDSSPRYYTGELYASLFFINRPVCNETDIVAGALQYRGKGQLEKNKAQLKHLIFNPGSDIRGVPFMGNKAAIFDPEVSKMYDFKLLSVDYNGEACFLFQAVPKPEHAGDVIYNNLATWFRKKDYAIVARDYSLSYKTMLYDFDVTMKVRLQPVGEKLLPTRVEYDGNWHVSFGDRERARFVTTFAY